MQLDKKIKHLIERATEHDKQFIDDCYHYDNMYACKWELPPGLAKDAWTRKRVSPEAKDIIKQGCNLFDTHNPKWDVLPLGPLDSDNAENKERWIEWQMARANTGTRKPFRDILKSSMQYDRIAYQLDCLSYWHPNPDKKTRDRIAQKHYCITVHHPGPIRYGNDGYGLLWVAKATVMSAHDVVEAWEAYRDSPKAPSVNAALGQINGWLDEDDDALCGYIDYQDAEKRRVYYWKTSQEVLGELLPEEVEVMFEGDNELGFINWVIMEGTAGSLLESIHRSGAWENQNLLDSLMDTTVIKRGYFPLFIHESSGGKRMKADFSGQEGTIEVERGTESVTPIPPPQIDPAIRELNDRNQVKMQQSSGLQSLSSIDAANVQFATIKAIFDMRMTELEPYKVNAEEALAQGAAMMFRWAEVVGAPISGYRRRAGKEGKARGAEIALNPGEFDPAILTIACKLLPNTPSDFQGMINSYGQIKAMNLSIPDEELIEHLDFGDPQQLIQAYEKEQASKTALEAWKQEKMGEVQLKLAQAQQALQQPPQVPQGGGINPANMAPPNQPAFEQAGGMGNAPPMGGQSPYQQVPNLTQTAMRGQ